MSGKITSAEQSVTRELQGMLRRQLASGGSLSNAISEVQAQLAECLRVATERLLQKRSIEEALSLPASIPCACGRSNLQLNGRARERSLDLACGSVTYGRAYYAPGEDCACPGRFPLDEKLGLPRGALDATIVEKLSLLSILMPFEQSIELLERLCGLKVSKKRAVATVGLVAETALKQLTKRAEDRWSRREELIANRPPAEQRKGTLFLSPDGTCVGIKKSESFKEVKSAVLFWDRDIEPRRRRKSKKSKARRNRRQEHDIKRKYIVSRVGGHEEFLRYLWDAFVEVGGLAAKRIVVIADGAEWIWNDVMVLFPSELFDVRELLDWYHLFENVWKAARELFEDPEDQHRWVRRLKQRQRIRDSVRGIEAELQRFLDRPLEPDKRKTVEQVLAYLQRNRHRTSYATFRQLNWPRGSAAIESVNHGVIQARFKLPGMRWTVDGVNRLLCLRNAYFSGTWDDVFSSAMEVYLHKPGGHESRTMAQTTLWKKAS